MSMHQAIVSTEQPAQTYSDRLRRDIAVLRLLAATLERAELSECARADDRLRVASISPTLAHHVWREPTSLA